MWNTIKPRRLETVVKLLSQKKATIDGFYHAYIFKPYEIDIEDVLANQDLEGAKRLLDFSFMTRQGGPGQGGNRQLRRGDRRDTDQA